MNPLQTKIAILCGPLCVGGVLFSAEIPKAANTDALVTGSSWATGTAPGSGDVALWNNLISAGNVSALGGNAAWQGIKVSDVGGTRNGTTNFIAIDNAASANTLTLGAGGIDMASALQAMRVQSKLTLTANQTWNVANANTNANPLALSVGEDLSFLAQAAAAAVNLGGFTVTKSGAGVVSFSSGWTVSNGSFAVNAGTLHLQGGTSRQTTLESSLNFDVRSGATLSFACQSGSLVSSAPITLNAGSVFTMMPAQGTTLTQSGPVTVAGNTTLNCSAQPNGNQNAAANVMISGNISGAGNITANNTVTILNRIKLAGDNSGYAGTLTLAGTAGERSLRLATATAGSAAATWAVNAGNKLEIDGVNVQLGTLAGAGTVLNSSATSPATISIGAGTFTGTIADGALPTSVRKTGPGTLELGGADTYTGETLVSAGTLVLSTAGLGATPVTVGAGATLAIRPATPGTTRTVSSLTTAATSRLAFPFGTQTNPTVPVLAPASGLTVGAGTVIEVTGLNLTAGTIPLISTGGTLGGAGFAGLSLAPTGRLAATLVNNTAAGTVDLKIIGNDVPRWTGAVNGTWDIDNGTGTGTANWRTSFSNTVTRYLQGAGGTDAAIFDDSATGTTTVSLAATVTPVAITFDNTTRSYSLVGSGKLSGGTPVIKKGSGSVTIANTGGNDLSGPVAVQAGMLRVGDGATIGGGSLGTGTITNDGVLVLDRPDDFPLGSLQGGGTLTKRQTSVATVTGPAAPTGPVEVEAGTLRFAGGGTLVSKVSGAGVLESSAGTLEIQGSESNTVAGLRVSGGTLRLNNPAGTACGGDVTITGGGVLVLVSPEQIPDTATVTFTGTSADSTAGTAVMETVADVVCNPSVPTGQFIMRAGFTVTGTGTVRSGILGVASSNTANVNAIVMTGGTLRIAGSGGPSVLNVGPGGINASGGVIEVKFNTNNQDATVNLGGDFTATGNVAINNAAYSGANLNQIVLDAPRAFDIASGATVTVQPDVTGAGALVKTGAGTLSLQPSCDLGTVGETKVQAGTLEVQGTLTGSDVTVAGGTLAGNGTLAPGARGVVLKNGGKLSPGTAATPAGTLTINGAALTLTEGVTPVASQALAFHLDTPSTSDSVVLGNGLVFIGGGVLEFDDFVFTPTANFAPGTYTLVDSIDSVVGSLGANRTGTIAGLSAQLALGDGGNDIVLIVTTGTNALQQWRQQYFGTTSATGSAANDADPDADGLANLAEFALGSVPNQPASRGGLRNLAGGATFVAEYTRPVAAVAVVDYVAQVSNDLVTWTSAGVTQTTLSDDGTAQSVRVSVDPTVPARWVRLKFQEK